MSNLQKEISDIVTILKAAKCEEIDGKRCFVVSHEKFCAVVDIIQGWTGDGATADTRLYAAGWESANLLISAGDKHVYYVVSKAVPTLDEIWKPK